MKIKFLSVSILCSLLVVGIGFFAQKACAAEAVLHGMTDSKGKQTTVTMPTVTPEALAKALSEWTGLDFFIQDVTIMGDVAVVDWAPNSTLIADLDNRPQKEEFHFFDADSMRWFMLDSLYKTLLENLGVKYVYFTANGGNALEFEELSAQSYFRTGDPYMGSPFYFQLAKEIQEGRVALRVDAYYAPLVGRWESKHPQDGKVLILSLGPDKNFARHTLDGTLYDKGTVNVVYEDGPDIVRFDLMDAANTFIDGFYVDNALQLHFGNDIGKEYLRMPPQ